MIGYSVKQITYNDTKPFILDIHYAKRMPSITYAYGLFYENELVGVVTYGSPPSQPLCKGVAGVDHRKKVIELNRLVLKNNKKNEASFLVGRTIKMLPQPSILISYADTSQNHTGYIYQATNFLYSGLSTKRKEWREIGSNKHSKTVCEQYSLKYRKENTDKFHEVDRPQKHRYIYIIANKKDKKQLLKDLKYPLMGYPKSNEEIKMKV